VTLHLNSRRVEENSNRLNDPSLKSKENTKDLQERDQTMSGWPELLPRAESLMLLNPASGYTFNIFDYRADCRRKRLDSWNKKVEDPLFRKEQEPRV